MIIKSVNGMEIVDSRGMPTVFAQVTLENGISGEASVPSGASVGAHEAVELRDGGDRLSGKGVLRAVDNINTLMANKLCGKNFSAQAQIDDFLRRMDDTENKSWLGANAILAVSMAAARAFAADMRIPLYEYLHSGGKFIMPLPMMNILNGGVHAANNVDIQEFMAVPVGASTFREAMTMGMEVYMALKARLRAAGLSTAVGDEGGFAPDLRADEEAIEYILAAARDAGLEQDIAIALDVAASEWYAGDGVYRLPKSGRSFSRQEQAGRICALIQAYPIVSVEDPMAEDDFEGFSIIAGMTDIQIVGDDLFVTNEARIRAGIDMGIANSILIKLNQIGTVWEAQNAIAAGQEAGYCSIISHRSGETEDTFIADFAVGSGAGQIKTGAPARGERTAKYNRLLRIEAEVGSQCALWSGFSRR